MASSSKIREGLRSGGEETQKDRRKTEMFSSRQKEHLEAKNKEAKAAFPGWGWEEKNGIRVRNQLSLIAQSGPCFRTRLQPPSPAPHYHHQGPGATWEWCHIWRIGTSNLTWASISINMWGPCLLSCNKAENSLSLWAYFVGRISISELLATRKRKINFLISLTFALSPPRASSKVEILHASPKAAGPSPLYPCLCHPSTSVSSLYKASFVLPRHPYMTQCKTHGVAPWFAFWLFLGGGGGFYWDVIDIKETSPI